MRLSEIKRGMQVVVSDAPSTQIYTVEEPRGLEVLLSYKSGGRECTSLIDVSALRKPTKKQLQNTARVK